MAYGHKHRSVVQARGAKCLELDIYGIYAQGSNEYYDDALTHTSLSPFAQIMLIEQARDAIRRGAHGRSELYLDEDFFRSLQFKDHKFRETVPSAPYKPKMTSSTGAYYICRATTSSRLSGGPPDKLLRSVLGLAPVAAGSKRCYRPGGAVAAVLGAAANGGDVGGTGERFGAAKKRAARTMISIT